MTRNDGARGAPDDLDLRLRGALEPPPEAVARIVGAALAGGHPAPRFRLVPVASVLAVLLAAAALLVRVPAPPANPLPASISIHNVGEVLIVRARDGRQSLANHREEGERSSPSSSLIVLYGD